MEASRDINRLIEIMQSLRDPQSGCPWDIKQTFETIMPYTIEEVYEVADAINRQNSYDFCEELGDLLLQIIFHARMAEEKNMFDFGDIVKAITTKMIRRHPHVFGSEEQKKRGLQKGDWEQIKAIEKEERRQIQDYDTLSQHPEERYLDSVRSSLPPYIEAIKLQAKAAEVGFDWKQAKPIFNKLDEEIDELKCAISEQDKNAIESEFGDVLFTILNLSRRLEISAEQALAKTNKKFRNRFSYIESELMKDGKKLSSTTLEEMERLWNKAKSLQNK